MKTNYIFLGLFILMFGLIVWEYLEIRSLNQKLLTLNLELSKISSNLSFQEKGKVGIGTTNVKTKLDIGSTGGAINLSGTGIDFPTEGLEYGLFPHENVGLGLYSYHGGISFWGGGMPSEYMRLMRGNLGIGTLNPTEKLEVNGGLRLNSSSKKPQCDISKRGVIWYTQKDEGMTDSLEVCFKDSKDNYRWIKIL